MGAKDLSILPNRIYSYFLGAIMEFNPHLARILTNN